MPKPILKRLFVTIGVLFGAIIGIGVTLLIGLIVELITQPEYPDLMMGWYLWPLFICVPLFAIIFGILSHRFTRRL